MLCQSPHRPRNPHGPAEPNQSRSRSFILFDVSVSHSRIVCLSAASAVAAQPLNSPQPDKQAAVSRRAQLVEANIIAVQAYQIILARKDGKATNACYPETSPDTATLQELVKHQTVSAGRTNGTGCAMGQLDPKFI